MTAFDMQRRCLVVRVVYDGPGLAGKTTNLQQLCELFPLEKRSELYTPGSLKGRTMFFDWLEINAGKIGKIPLRFQLLTVPGQVQRNYRRRPLVEMADAIVFVCDCRQEQTEVTKHAYVRLRRVIRKQDRHLPLVIQANKQDVPGALDAAAIRKLLRIGEEVPIISSEASNGSGVRETIVMAMRQALKQVQVQLRAEGLANLPTNAGNADDLFMQMHDADDARWDDDYEPDPEDDPNVSDEELAELGLLQPEAAS